MRDAVNEVLSQVAARVAGALTSFLPGILALFIILGLATMIAFVLRVSCGARWSEYILTAAWIGGAFPAWRNGLRKRVRLFWPRAPYFCA